MRETTLPNEGSQCRRVLLHRGRHRLESLRALSTRLDLGKPVQYLLLHTAESSFFCRFVATSCVANVAKLGYEEEALSKYIFRKLPDTALRLTGLPQQGRTYNTHLSAARASLVACSQTG
jgi:hypothetical protein